MNCDKHKETAQSEECVECLKEQIKRDTETINKILPKNTWTAALIVIEHMDHTLYNTMAGMKKDDLISLHHDFGRQIRNVLRLWDKELNKDLFDNSETDCPDTLSMKIIEAIWDKIKVEVGVES